MLGYDRGTYIPPFRLHEQAEGLAGTTDPEALELRVRGYAHANGEARVLAFQGVSASEDLVPSSSPPASRAVLDAFQAGAEVRVYRNWPSVTVAWNDIDGYREGYSDLVVQGGATDITYEWGGPVARRFNFEIVGLEV